MNIYTYSDLVADSFTAMSSFEAESITDADAMATAVGLKIMKQTVSIGIRLIVIDLSKAKAPALLYKGKLVNSYHYWNDAFSTNIFCNKQALLDAHKNDLKVWLYNPNIQLFWEYPTAHGYKLRVCYN